MHPLENPDCAPARDVAERSVADRSVNVPRYGESSAQPVIAGVAKHAIPARSIWPEIGWLLPLLLIPLWVNFWTFQPFDHAKSLLLTGLMWIATGLTLAARIWRNSARPTLDNLSPDTPVQNIRPQFRLSSSPLHMAVVLWLCVLGLATVWAVDPMLSLFGSDLRGQGLLAQFSYAFFFFLLARGIQSQAQIARLFDVVAVGTIPLLAIGYMQAAGMDPLGLVSDARSSVHSTLGRANFTGAYLALVLPITLNRVVAAERMWARGAWMALWVAQIGVLALTLARSAWLGAVVGLAVFGLLLLWSRRAARLPFWLRGAWRRRAAWGCGVAVVAGAGYGAVRLLAGVTEGSLAARVVIWQATAALIRERPWTGYGLENLEIAFLWVYPPQLVYYQGRDVYVDRAHNLLLDWTFAAGLPGLVALLALLGAFLYVAAQGWNAAQRGTRTRLHLTTVLAVTAAATAGNFTSFDVTATALLIWAVLGVAVSRPLLPSDARPSDEPRAWVLSGKLSSRWRTGQWVRGPAAVVVLGLALAVVSYGVVRPTLAGIAHQSAVEAARQGAWTQANRYAQRAIALWPNSPAHQLLAGQVAEALAAQSSEAAQLAHLQRAEAAYWAVIERRPTDAAAWADLGNFYAAWPQQVDLPTARTAYDRALALAPNLAIFWFDAARLHVRHGDAAGALDALQRSVDLDATHVSAYRLMGELYAARGDGEAADRAFAEVLRIEQAAREAGD